MPEHVLHEALKPGTFCIVAEICFEHVLDIGRVCGDVELNAKEHTSDGERRGAPQELCCPIVHPMLVTQKREEGSDKRQNRGANILAVGGMHLPPFETQESGYGNQEGYEQPERHGSKQDNHQDGYECRDKREQKEPEVVRSARR